MRDRAKVRLNDVRGLLNCDVAVVRNALMKHIEKIVLRPSGKYFVASGTWNLLERVPTDGAGGPACTVLPQAKFFVDLAA
jgi:hypothetical protein